MDDKTVVVHGPPLLPRGTLRFRVVMTVGLVLLAIYLGALTAAVVFDANVGRSPFWLAFGASGVAGTLFVIAGSSREQG